MPRKCKRRVIAVEWRRSKSWLPELFSDNPVTIRRTLSTSYRKISEVVRIKIRLCPNEHAKKERHRTNKSDKSSFKCLMKRRISESIYGIGGHTCTYQFLDQLGAPVVWIEVMKCQDDLVRGNGDVLQKKRRHILVLWGCSGTLKLVEHCSNHLNLHPSKRGMAD